MKHQETNASHEGVSAAYQEGAIWLVSSNSNELGQPRFKVLPVVQPAALGAEDDNQSSTGVVSGSGSSGAIFAIYMEDEEAWTGVDIDDDSTVDRQLYQVMIAFLRDYFCPSEQTTSAGSKLPQSKGCEIKSSGAEEKRF